MQIKDPVLLGVLLSILLPALPESAHSVPSESVPRHVQAELRQLTQQMADEGHFQLEKFRNHPELGKLLKDDPNLFLDHFLKTAESDPHFRWLWVILKVGSNLAVQSSVLASASGGWKSGLLSSILPLLYIGWTQFEFQRITDWQNYQGRRFFGLPTSSLSENPAHPTETYLKEFELILAFCALAAVNQAILNGFEGGINLQNLFVSAVLSLVTEGFLNVANIRGVQKIQIKFRDRLSKIVKKNSQGTASDRNVESALKVGFGMMKKAWTPSKWRNLAISVFASAVGVAHLQPDLQIYTWPAFALMGAIGLTPYLYQRIQGSLGELKTCTRAVMGLIPDL